MTLGDLLILRVEPYQALVLAGFAALISTLFVMPKLIRKLRGAGIIGRDINKPDRPEVAEMGGLGVFLGFYTGVFALLLLAAPAPAEHTLVLVSLITLAGATMTGILDDLIELRQRFKAFIPLVFAAPMAVYVEDQVIAFPFLGAFDLGLLYSLVLVPIGITCASNGFNMLEGYNGLGAGIGIVLTSGMIALALLVGEPTGLAVLVPLLGALLGFLWFNKFPARAFPGDTMTLLVGAALAVGAILSKIEFWGALLFLPHIVEFAIKGANGFPSRGWQGENRDGKLYCPSERPVSIPQWTMRWLRGATETRLVTTIVVAEALFVVAIVAAARVAG